MKNKGKPIKKKKKLYSYCVRFVYILFYLVFDVISQKQKQKWGIRFVRSTSYMTTDKCDDSIYVISLYIWSF